MADADCRGYLDIADFRRLVKLLNSRSEIDQLYQNVTKDYGGRLNYPCFEKFMRQDQKVKKNSFYWIPASLSADAGARSREVCMECVAHGRRTSVDRCWTLVLKTI